MKSKLIAASAFHISVKSKKHLKVILQNSFTQRGFTLIELMVGIVIGLLVVAAAMGSLMVSRSISGTVNDASNIQQQAAYAMRTIGLQLRQAGSLYLNLNPAETAAENSALAAVGFERKAGDFEAGKNIVRGIDAPTGAEFKLTTGYRNYKEALHGKTVDESQVRDCLGQQPSDTLIENNFVLKTSTNELYCAGSNKTAQPVVENVANFQVRYLVQESATAGDTKINLLGEISSMLETGANDVMVVSPCDGSIDQRERLLPYVDVYILQVDLENKQMLVDWDPEF